VLLLLACVITVCGAAYAQKPAAGDQQFFDDRVAPILSKRCLGCHNNELNDGNISFEDRQSLIKGGGRGPAVVPGKPERSVLVRAIRHNGDPQMPPGQKLPDADIATLIEWIRRGAPWGTKLRPRH
jgi:mono/diheme cytochrome c family protein